jgi:hypothetical protein
MGMKICPHILFLFLLFSCNSKNDDAAVPNEYAAKQVSQLNTTDTFLYELPVNREGEIDTLSIQYLAEFEELLHLPILTKGVDSIEIRIDFDIALFDKTKLVILKHDGNKWVAQFSKVLKHFNPVTEKVDSLSREVVYKNPKSGWVLFVNRLLDLKILTLDDNNKIPNFWYARPTDGDEIGVQVATKNVYRFYNYDNPSEYNEKYWQAANVMAIEKLFYDEFDILDEWDKQIQEEMQRDADERERIREENNNKKPRKVKVDEMTIEEPKDSISKK